MNRHWPRCIIGGFLALFLIFLSLVPVSSRINYETTATEYSMTDVRTSTPHEVIIDGYYHSNIWGNDSFHGTFYISNVKGLTNQKNNANFTFSPKYRYSPAFLTTSGEPKSTEISTILFDKNFQRLAIQFAYTFESNDTSFFTAAGDSSSTFLVIGAANREEAISKYTELLEEKLL